MKEIKKISDSFVFAYKAPLRLLVSSLLDLSFLFMFFLLQYAFVETNFSSAYQKIVRILSQNTQATEKVILDMQGISGFLGIPGMSDIIIELVISLAVFIMVAFLLYSVTNGINWYLVGDRKKSMLDYMKGFFLVNIPFFLAYILYKVIDYVSDLSSSLASEGGEIINNGSLIIPLIIASLAVVSYSLLYRRNAWAALKRLPIFVYNYPLRNCKALFVLAIAYFALNYITMLLYMINDFLLSMMGLNLHLSTVLGLVLFFPLLFVMRRYIYSELGTI